MKRLIDALFGRTGANIAAEADQHRAEHEQAMQAVQMKVDALQTGADRVTRESRKTEEAAAAMLARLREDFPR